ncbi:MAG: lipoyl(octanoyl) transferase LipB [Rickettsiales bacterium]|jgi:lipoyl(octanoyl) transferase|nr:lipoyl(octanoyl) transferase LipB [Rickettsiales bacterium]
MVEKEIIWSQNDALLDYDLAVDSMENHVNQMILGKEKEKIWLVEHDHIYTLGVSGKETDIINKTDIPIKQSKRGGKITYHGPGMRIIYVMLDLNKGKDGRDIRKFIQSLEHWVIDSLKHYGIDSFIRDDRVGIWVMHQGVEKKIAAIGVRVRKWVTYHGIAINIAPDLAKFSNIIPCGIDSKKYGVTSLKAMGVNTDFKEFDAILKKEFFRKFT